MIFTSTLSKILTFSLALSGLIFTQYSMAQSWSSYTFPKAGLKCDFPGEPSHDITTKENATTHKIKVTYKGAVYAFVATKSAVNLEENGESGETLYAAFKKKYKEANKAGFKYAGKYGVEAKLISEKTHINYRSLVVGNYSFQAMVINVGSFATAPDVNRFFSSFVHLEKEVELKKPLAPVVNVVGKDWKSYTFPKAGLKCNFPGEPSHDITTKENATTHKIKVTYKGAVYAFVATKSAVNLEENGESGETLYAAFKKKYKEANKAGFKYAGKNGVEAKLISEKTHINYRSLVVGNYSFQAMVINVGSFATAPDVNRFFSSFVHLEKEVELKKPLAPVVNVVGKDWKSYTFPKAGLKCNFPGEPSHDITTKENATTHKIKVTYKGAVYAFVATKSAVNLEENGESGETLYADFKKKYKEANKAGFKYAGKNGVEAKLISEKTHINYRSLVVGNYSFQAMVINVGSFATASDVNRFFSSFVHINDTQPINKEELKKEDR